MTETPRNAARRIFRQTYLAHVHDDGMLGDWSQQYLRDDWEEARRAWRQVQDAFAEFGRIAREAADRIGVAARTWGFEVDEARHATREDLERTLRVR